MDMNEMQGRIALLEDRVAIEWLIANYAHGFDGRDASIVRTLWHEDAALLLGAPFGEYVGIEAIMDFAEASWKTMLHTHHWMSNVVIDLEQDRARAIVALNAHSTHSVTGPLQVSGLYHDRFERRNGRWAFVERRFALHYLTPLPGWTPTAGNEALSASNPAE